jgi:DNA-binding SARP family transcriptional activator
MPSRSAHLSDAGTAYPIQVAKVQRPALRDETLERPRLLDWLRAKIHGRVVLLLADAGYGKTTLLADYARRTRMRTLWYRLDHDDRDWVTLLHHLIAAGREYDPTFAPATSGLLSEIGVGGPTREAALDTFLRELPSIVTGGAVLIFDDFHLVDDAPDARFVARELVARAPERLTIVFASRRTPTVPLSRLRSVGEVAELDTDALRFDAAETAKLFTETYGRRLDPDVLEDLAIRTEGWIASLQLVQAALRDRSPTEIRRFVRSLNGADRDLYDYLAEEVVGDLPDDLQRFLMDTSILQVVTPELAEVVSGRDAADVARLTAAAERLTLLSRLSGGPRTHQRYHPLVREFLEGRFRSIDGPDAVASLHRRTAAATAATDWRIGAHHYREAGDTEAMLGVVATAIPDIMGNGQYALAEAFIGPISAGDRPAGFDLILSRVDMQQGDYEAAIAASQAVLDSGVTDPVQRDHALLNLVTLHLNYGDGDSAHEFASELFRVTSDPNLRLIADASIAGIGAAEDAPLDVMNRKLRAMASAQRTPYRHHFGVTLFNLATNSLIQDRLGDAILEVSEAIQALEETSASIELASAATLRLTILAQQGNWVDYERYAADFAGQVSLRRDPDVLIDLADERDSFGAPDEMWAHLDQVDAETPIPTFRTLAAATRTRALIRRGRHEEARAAIDRVPKVRATYTGTRSMLLFTHAYLASAAASPSALALALDARAYAAKQGAHRWRRLSDLLAGIISGPPELDEAIGRVADPSPWHLTYLADLLLPCLENLTGGSLDAIATAANMHSARWLFALRRYVDMTERPSLEAAQLLEQIGERDDVVRLRRIAKDRRRSPSFAPLGRALARRTADLVFVEDQGRVSLRIGKRSIPGGEIRRKVLALLCFLITRPDLSGTRDQVLEALWPELDPEVAVNSLNQTLYFLRRVFEENYTEDLSPGYVKHDSDVIWIDAGLLKSRSREARTLIRGFGSRPTPEDVEALVTIYRGRFALDFEYEEWAAAYRDSLHASFLEIVERSVLDDFRSGHYDRGIAVARQALEIDSSAEQIEVGLLRLYRVTGAHSAAAEQYEHYASVMRDELGVEPLPLDAL